MTLPADFKDVKNAVTSALIETTKATGQIANEDLAFHRSSNPAIVPLLDKQNARLLKLARSLTKTATLGSELAAPQMKDVESVDDSWRGIVDVFDNLLEKADACLDEYTGSIKRLSPGQEEKAQKAISVQGKQRPSKTYRNQNIVKPQLLFNTISKNDEQTSFKPLLRRKPHAIVPLEDSIGLDVSKDVDRKQFRHPYETEIDAAHYPPSTFLKSDPIPYLPYNSTKATLVDTPEGVTTMLADLQQAKEIAIDLEHHDEHSYVGLVSLMQISTREKDWIVDTLKPWRQDLQVLNEVFTDPNIVKVFHGAFMDMIWLQRDLGLYVVGLFDTFHASRALGYPKHSLAYLLKRFADFDAAKQYQTADWRIRPLPEEMFDYARSDTHFLLYIYDEMRNELLKKSSISQKGENFIEKVMNNSKEEALQRYEHPFYDSQRGLGSMGWYNMLYRTPTLFNREQFAVFRAVHQWRDHVARQEDESVHSIMPKHVLFSIAREIPLDMSSLFGCSHPISKPFHKRKDDLLEVVKRAKIDGADGPEMKELMQEIDLSFGQKNKINGRADALPVENTQPVSHPRTSVEPDHNVLPLRYENSRFWGSSLPSITATKVTNKAPGISLTLPLPQLDAEASKEDDSIKPSKMQEVKADSGAPIERSNVAEKPSRKDEIFIPKQDGGSRKRKAGTNLEGSDDASLRDNSKTSDRDATENALDRESDIDRNREKAAKKAEKERLKKEKKLMEQANGSTKRNDATTEAFDYTSAPSVLHATLSSANQAAAANKGINPYAKSMDAPKGMRQSKKEIAAKSHTFNR